MEAEGEEDIREEAAVEEPEVVRVVVQAEAGAKVVPAVPVVLAGAARAEAQVAPLAVLEDAVVRRGTCRPTSLPPTRRRR